MKTKLIRTLMLAATIPAVHGQTALPVSATPDAAKTTRSSSAGLTTSASAGGGQPSFQQRLNSVVRRAGESAGGSLILTSALPDKQMNELAEDMGVLNFIFSRNLERAFADKTTEYRLGVPITLNSRMVDTGYIQDYGVLVKVHVPFPVATTDKDSAKKSDATANPDSEWERARRAVYGGGEGSPGAVTAQGGMAYDERLVDALKKQMLDAMKNASNLRNIPSNQFVTVVIYGGPAASRGAELLSEANLMSLGNATMLTLRVTKEQADAAAKNSKSTDEFAKEASVHAYFDTAAPVRATTGYGAVMGGYPAMAR